MFICVVFFPARPFTIPANTERANPSAEHSAADLEGGGCGAARFNSGTLQEDPVSLS